jgi:UDP:flavonoid glycosyltransferase YjiC (YdhE family)
MIIFATMAKVFIELSTGIGPLIRCLPITLWLRDHGHQVRYFARDNSTRYMQKFGLQPIDLDPDAVAYKKCPVPGWGDVDDYWGSWGFNDSEWLSDRIGQWKAALTRYAPDVVVADFAILSSITARLLRLPLVMVTQSCCHPGVFGGKQRFWDPAYVPQHRSRDAANRLFAQLGEPALQVGTFEDLFVGDRTIIPSLPQVDVLEKGKEHDTLFPGPILWDGIYQGLEQSQWPSFPTARPVIFIYTGRMNDGAGNSGEIILRAVLDSARSQRFNVVISTGGMDDIPSDIDLSLPNVQVIKWVPMETAYRNSDLVVHHGGHGSCMGGLKYAVPALIIPTHTEREYNARLLKRISCADIILRGEVTGALIEDKICALLQDSKVKEAVRSYARVIEGEYANGEQRAGESIAALIG